MTEIQLFKMLVALVPPAVALRNGGQALGLVLAYQPTQQGVAKADTIAMSTAGISTRYGWPQKVARWDADAGVMRNYESQAMETPLQITMQARGKGTDTDPTEVDLCQLVADAVQSDSFIESLRPHAQVLRVSNVRMGRFIGDDGQHANWPNFDLVIKHTRTYVDGVPEVTKWDGLYLHAVV